MVNLSRRQLSIPIKRIGVLVIGQSPRPDLVGPLKRMLPECELVQVGALDGILDAELPELANAVYPLSTRLRDGKIVLVDESFLLPRLQHALDYLEVDGVSTTILMCAGTFESLNGSKPLFKPFLVGCGVLKVLGAKSIGVITPVAGQEKPIETRWSTMGFFPTVLVADISSQDPVFYDRMTEWIKAHSLDCLVLDYVGHATSDVQRLQRYIQIPVIDLGSLTIAALASTV